MGAAIEAAILNGKEDMLVEGSLMIECSAKDILVKVCLASLYFSIKIVQTYCHNFPYMP